MNSPKTSQDQIRRNLQFIGVALDSQFSFLGIRIGWDGIIGLIPVFGDLLTTLVSIYIVVSASQLGVPISVLSRMGINIVIDNLISGIPVLGWFFDFVYRSNLKNLALIDRYLEHPSRVRTQSRLLVGGLIAGFFILSAALIVGMAWLFYQFGSWILQSFQG